MALSSSLVLDEARLLLSRTLFPGFLLAPLRTTVAEQSHLHLVRHLLHHSWSWFGGVQYPELQGRSNSSSPVELVRSSYLLSLLAYPFYRVDPNVDLVATLRVVLSLLSALSSIWLARRIRPTFGTRTAKYYLVFEATQLLATREMTRLDGVSLAMPLVRIASALLITPRLPSPLDDDIDDRPRNASSNKIRSLDTVLGLGLLALASVVLCPALISLLVPSLWNAWSSGSVDGLQVLGILGGLIGVEAALTNFTDQPLLLLFTLPTNHISQLFSTSQNLDRSSLLLPYLTLLGPTLFFSTFAFLVDKRCRTLLGPVIIALLSVYYFPWIGGGGGGGGGGEEKEEEMMKRVRILVLLSSTACGVGAATSARLVGIMFGKTAQNSVLGSVVLGNLYLALRSTVSVKV